MKRAKLMFYPYSYKLLPTRPRPYYKLLRKKLKFFPKIVNIYYDYGQYIMPADETELNEGVDYGFKRH